MTSARWFNARLRGRFLRGAEQVWLQPEEWRDEPSLFNWASVRRITACALETTGTGERDGDHHGGGQ